MCRGMHQPALGTNMLRRYQVTRSCSSPVKDSMIRRQMAVLLTSPGGNCKSTAVLHFIVSVMLEVEPRAEYIPDH